ncbi:MAG TPA: CHRD domain-containing protein [Gaiellaceae bacterium]|nr:CHRD domain-containing protein [Gaiellaceae bacterium]
MKKLASGLALVVLAALVAASLATAGHAKQVEVTAALTAKQEVPAQVVKDAKAKGAFTGTLVGSKLKWKLTFSGLTGPASAAHIHLGGMGKAGNVLVALCGPCTNGQKGTATLTAAAAKALKKHLAYVNVHTAKNPNGEIRGQLSEH